MNNDEMKTIFFGSDGQPVADEIKAETFEGKDGAGETAGGQGRQEAEHGEQRHKATLKEKVTELQLEIDVLKNELENAQKETDGYIALAQRQKADFDNYKKRNAEAAAGIRQEGLIEGVLKILPVYDVIVKALSMIEDKNTLKGLNMIMQQLNASFKDMGVEMIESLGREFDPDYHNAIMNEEAADEGEKGKVTDVFQEGFMMGGKVIRYAMVKVAV